MKLLRLDQAYPIERLRPYPGNYRQHDLEFLAQSLERGQHRTVVVREATGEVLAGNGVYHVAMEKGWPALAVSLIEADDAECQEIVVTDNRSQARGKEDVGLLASLLEEIDSRGRLEAVGYSQDDLADLLAAVNAPPSDLVVEDDSGHVAATFDVYGKEELIEDAFHHYRETGFPFPELALHERKQEINRLAATPTERLLHTTTAHHVADMYHRHRWQVPVGGMRSPLETFQEDAELRHALALSLEQNGVLSDGTVRGKLVVTHGTQVAANFRPGTALWLYRRFCPDSGTILDTSAGFGGRLVGFLASAATKYVGIDPSEQTDAGNRALLADLQPTSKTVELVKLPAEDVEADLLRDSCDFAFTSPPYFAKEMYADEPTQSWKRYRTPEAWRDGFLRPMMRLTFEALKPQATCVLNVADVTINRRQVPLVDWTMEAGKAAGFVFGSLERYPMSRTIGTEETDNSEPLLIFRKETVEATNAA